MSHGALVRARLLLIIAIFSFINVPAVNGLGYYAAVTNFAGNGAWTLTNGVSTSASFANPFGVTIDALGNLYVADFTCSLSTSYS